MLIVCKDQIDTEGVARSESRHRDSTVSAEERKKFDVTILDEDISRGKKHGQLRLDDRDSVPAAPRSSHRHGLGEAVPCLVSKYGAQPTRQC